MTNFSIHTHTHELEPNSFHYPAPPHFYVSLGSQTFTTPRDLWAALQAAETCAMNRQDAAQTTARARWFASHESTTDAISRGLIPTHIPGAELHDQAQARGAKAHWEGKSNPGRKREPKHEPRAIPAISGLSLDDLGL